MISQSGRFCIAMVLLLAGCGADDEMKPDVSSPSYVPDYMIYSPNGEPLNGGALGRPTCLKAMSGWFDRLGDGHGTLSREVFLSDARIQFKRMDIDHNGYIVSEELERFRAPYRQQPRRQASESDAEPKKGHSHQKTQDRSHATGTSESSLFDPVMSADANFDFKVTPDEFIKQASDVFAKLDTNHDGSLDRAEVLAVCGIKQ